MEIQDLAIKYKGLYQEIEFILNNIKEIGFEVSEYQTMLNRISNKVNENIKINYVEGFARAGYEQDYARGIKELQKLKNMLDKYDVYYKVMNSCKWINSKINNKELSQEQLEKYVSEMIYNFKLIFSSDTTDYDNEKHIVNEVCKTAYNIIKLEIILTGDSQLYKYVINSGVNVSYFSILIKNDINKLDLIKNKYVKEKEYEIYKRGINSNYFDLELIKILLASDESLDLKQAIVNNIQNLKEEIEHGNKRIDNLTKDALKYIICTSTNKKEINTISKILRKKITTYLVTLSLIITGGVGLQKGAKSLATQDVYLKTTEIYSSVTDDIKTNKEKVFSITEPSREVKIREYESQSKTYRNYLEYDVSFEDFDTLKDYYEYGIDNYHVEGVPGEEKIQNDSAISKYDDRYIEVISSTYEYIEKGLYKELYFTLCMLIVCMFSIISINEFSEIINSIIEFEKELKKLNNEKKNYKDFSIKLKKAVDKLIIEINKNEDLKNKFNELYDTNKHLLDNPDEIIKKISGMDINENDLTTERSIKLKKVRK